MEKKVDFWKKSLWVEHLLRGKIWASKPYNLVGLRYNQLPTRLFVLELYELEAIIVRFWIFEAQLISGQPYGATKMGAQSIASALARIACAGQ